MKANTIACGECGGDVRMKLKGINRTRTHRIYKCPFNHVYVQPIILHPRPKTPDSAA